MIKNIVLAALMTLFMGVIAVSAQDKKPDFSGSWDLDVSKSKLGDRMRIESMSLAVSQTDKELSVKSTTKRTPPPEGAMQGGGGGGRMGGMGGGMGRGMGEVDDTYALDGKEKSVDRDTPMGKAAVKLKASFEKDGKLKLTSSRTVNGQMGEMTLTTKETWSLSPDGKTLTVNRDMESPRGTNSTEMVFTKK